MSFWPPGQAEERLPEAPPSLDRSVGGTSHLAWILLMALATLACSLLVWRSRCSGSHPDPSEVKQFSEV